MSNTTNPAASDKATPLCECEPPCLTFTDWANRHCYDCGRLHTESGPRDLNHILCFQTVEDLTPEQRSRLRPPKEVAR